jgi:DNA invertase Pin-like site-specific DNA recombinase
MVAVTIRESLIEMLFLKLIGVIAVSTCTAGEQGLQFESAAQFEASRERTRTALAASRGHARCRVGGRPPAGCHQGHSSEAMLASGKMTASEVARRIGCSSSTLYRHLPSGDAVPWLFQ